jgi:hypothetical protein
METWNRCICTSNTELFVGMNNISANESLLKSGKKNTNHYQTNIFDWGYTFEQQHIDKVLFLNSKHV